MLAATGVCIEMAITTGQAVSSVERELSMATTDMTAACTVVGIKVAESAR